MKLSRRKSFIFSVVIVCFLLFFGPIIFSSISGAQTQIEKNAQQENQVTIHGEDTLTITTTDSFRPEQYYKAVDDEYQPVKMNYTDVNANDPGRYALTLTAKNDEDHAKRTVLIIVKERKIRKKRRPKANHLPLPPQKRPQRNQPKVQHHSLKQNPVLPQQLHKLQRVHQKAAHLH